jgi:hypothetical protein
MHVEAFSFFKIALRDLPRRDSIVEIGARNINGTLRQLFVETPPFLYVGVDIAAGPLVDVVADGATFTPDSMPDTVLCAEVFEHTNRAWAICENVLTMLAPGGLFLVSAASDPRPPHSAVDGGPLREGEYYRNVPPTMLEQWLSGFSKVHVQHDQRCGDVYAVAWK